MRILSLTILLTAVLPGIQLRSPQDPGVLAIRNVTVVPGDGSPSLPAQTVVIRGERIAAIGPADQTQVPAGAVEVDGTDRFLMPGLIDLHVHLSKTRGSALGLFVASGVTTVRDMGGEFEELLRWRREIGAGTRIGPRMLIAGPYLESARNIARMRKDPPESRVEPFERARIPVGSPAEARRIVAELASREVDFLKIRTVENDETYRALNEAAQAHGLRLVGHVYGLSPKLVLDAGQDGIDHNFYPSLAGTREERMAVWRAFAARGVPCVPTLVTFFEGTFPPVEHLKAVVEDEAGRVDPRRAYLSRFLVLDWREQVEEATPERTGTLRRVYNEVVRRDLREMHEAGMDILAGSDNAVLNIFPDSIHEELLLMAREVGLTPMEIIARSTSRAAAFLGLGDSIGTVKRGKTADLLLLDADPTLDIANTRRISNVFVRGRHYGSRELDALREAARNAEDRRVNDWPRVKGGQAPKGA